MGRTGGGDPAEVVSPEAPPARAVREVHDGRGPVVLVRPLRGQRGAWCRSPVHAHAGAEAAVVAAGVLEPVDLVVAQHQSGAQLRQDAVVDVCDRGGAADREPAVVVALLRTGNHRPAPGFGTGQAREPAVEPVVGLGNQSGGAFHALGSEPVVGPVGGEIAQAPGQVGRQRQAGVPPAVHLHQRGVDERDAEGRRVDVAHDCGAHDAHPPVVVRDSARGSQGVAQRVRRVASCRRLGMIKIPDHEIEVALRLPAHHGSAHVGTDLGGEATLLLPARKARLVVRVVLGNPHAREEARTLRAASGRRAHARKRAGRGAGTVGVAVPLRPGGLAEGEGNERCESGAALPMRSHIHIRSSRRSCRPRMREPCSAPFRSPRRRPRRWPGLP